MQRDFPVATTPRHRVYFMARALRLLRDPHAYSSTLINAEGVRVYRVVWNTQPSELTKYTPLAA